MAAFCVSLPSHAFSLRHRALHTHRASSRRALRHVVMSTSAPSASPRLLSFLSRAEEGNPALGLQRADAAFSKLRSEHVSIPDPFVTEVETSVRKSGAMHYDIVIAGGTLGIIYATALVCKGWKVAVIERGLIKGRTQEWNTSREELEALVTNGVLSETELEQVIVTEFEKGRIGFELGQGGKELYAKGVLNVGVAPDEIVEKVKRRFKEMGGNCLEGCSIKMVQVGKDGVGVVMKSSGLSVKGALGAGGSGLVEESSGEERYVSGRVLVDAMGVFSPIAQQSRGYRKPDGVCVTVGACLKGEWGRDGGGGGDLIYSMEGIDGSRNVQYFWEMFPVDREENGRTTYLFCYGGLEGRRTLTQSLEDYMDKLENYQGVKVEDMEVKRVLFGFFPSYFKSSPTKVMFDRILCVGDAGGLQSPISFGGFGCCLRHLGRITDGLDEALKMNGDRMLMKEGLQMLQWYLPSLSVSGLFHSAMAVRPGENTAGPLLDKFGINEVLWSNMKAMAQLGEDVQKPFLQDVITAGGLSKTLAAMALSDPVLALRMTAFLGPVELLDWSRHYIALVAYAAALPALMWAREAVRRRKTASPESLFWWNRVVDAAMYGSGRDVTLKH